MNGPGISILNGGYMHKIDPVALHESFLSSFARVVVHVSKYFSEKEHSFGWQFFHY